MDFVALETIRELQKRNDGNEYYIIVAPGKDHCLEESANLSIVEVACPTYPLWEQIALPLAVKRLGADLLHCTSNTAPLCCPVPLVLTLHDIIYLEPRQQRSPSLYQEMGRHYRRLTVPRILKKCRKIITVSHFERNRIREALNIPADRITTIYNGYSRNFIKITQTKYIIEMESIKLKELNDQELLQEKKKFDTNKIINASLIGLLLGVFAYSAVKSGFTFFTFFPLFFAFILFIRGQKRNEFEKELKNEISSRNLK
jgi:glycosyltransferase involved in cell wall biosynthesis